MLALKSDPWSGRLRTTVQARAHAQGRASPDLRGAGAGRRTRVVRAAEGLYAEATRAASASRTSPPWSRWPSRDASARRRGARVPRAGRRDPAAPTGIRVGRGVPSRGPRRTGPCPVTGGDGRGRGPPRAGSGRRAGCAAALPFGEAEPDCSCTSWRRLRARGPRHARPAVPQAGPRALVRASGGGLPAGAGHPFPAAVEDALAVVTAIARDRAEPLTVGGDSSGGALAAAAALLARDRGGPALAHSSCSTRRDRRHDGRPRSMSWPRDGCSRSTPRLDVRPLPAGRGRGARTRWPPRCWPSHDSLAPAVIVTAGNDPLRDDGIRYAQRLQDACVYVDHLAYSGTIHSFMLYTGALETGLEAAAAVGAALRELLRTPRNRLEIAQLVRNNA